MRSNGLKWSLVLVCMVAGTLWGCKKDNRGSEDTGALPVVTNMQYDRYDGNMYTEGPHFQNPFILNNLGVPNSTILINGHNFSQDFKESKVLFNNISTTAIVGDSTKIIVMIPDNIPPGPVTLTIQTNGKTIVHPTKFTVETPNPQISGLSSGGAMSGGKLIIYGRDFSTSRANTKVTVNGVNATVDSSGLTAVYLTLPANSSSGKLILTTHGVAVTYKDDFKIVSSTFQVSDPGVVGFGPQNLAFDATGNVYGTIDNKVYKILPNGTATLLATLPAGADAIPYIGGCAVDASGNVYIALQHVRVPSRSSIQINGPAKIYKVTPSGTLSVFAGKDYSGASVDGQGANAQFWGPKHLAFDASGTLYVNDQTAIRKITPDGTVSTFANVTSVMAMAIDIKTGNLYVMEPAGSNSTAFSARIRKIAPDGSISIPTIDPLPGALSGGLFPDVKLFYQTAAHLAFAPAGDLLVAMGPNLYQLKNSVMTNIYLNPTTGNIIALAPDAAGKVYLTLPSNVARQSNSGKFLIYKAAP